MNLGKFVGSAAVAAIKEWNPRGPEAIKRRAINKGFRKVFKKARRGETLTAEEQRVMAEQTLTLPNGETITRTEPLIPARTSTKAFVGSAIGAYPGYQVVQMIQDAVLPWPWLEDFTNSAAFVWLCATIIPIVIARFTKSPLAKRAL